MTKSLHIKSPQALPIYSRGKAGEIKDTDIKDRFLDVEHIVPDHGALGDVSLIAKERAFIVDLQARALALKRQGVSVSDAGKQLTAEFKAKYPDWENMDLVATFVERVYEEAS